MVQNKESVESLSVSHIKRTRILGAAITRLTIDFAFSLSHTQLCVNLPSTYESGLL